MLLLVIALSIVAPDVPSIQAQVPFTVSVSPDRIVLGTMNGSSSWLDATVMAGEGFNGTVSFSVFGTPPGVTAVFQDRVVYLTPLAVFSTCLEVTALPDARSGNYTLTVGVASQGSSVFYAVAYRVTLIIQDAGQPRTPLGCKKTRVTTPSAPGQEYVISPIILGLVAGIAIGSIATYSFMRKRTRPAKEGHSATLPKEPEESLNPPDGNREYGRTAWRRQLGWP